MFNFEKLTVYHDALKLALDIYKLTHKFPSKEIYGLTSQLRRASISISLNIAEGSSRGKKEFKHFLNIARGSLYECIPLLEISLGLKYLTTKERDTFYDKVDMIARKINALNKSIKL